jgi:hypothetical protein
VGQTRTCTRGMDAPVELALDGALPVACTLGPDDGRGRMLRWQRLDQRAAPVARLVDGQLEVRYRPGEGIQEELAELAAAEQICCSFATWEVSSVKGQPVLRVTASAEDPDAVGAIAALFGAAPNAT